MGCLKANARRCCPKFPLFFWCLIIVIVYPSSAHSRQDVIRLITPSQSTGRVHDFASNQTAVAVSMETEVAECHAKHFYLASGKPQRAPCTKARRLFGKCHKCGF